MSPWLGYVSQNSLPCMLPVRMGQRLRPGGQKWSSSTLFTRGVGAGAPRAVAVHACWHVSAGSPRGRGAAARPAARPAAAPPCLGSSSSFSRVPGPGAYLTL